MSILNKIKDNIARIHRGSDKPSDSSKHTVTRSTPKTLPPALGSLASGPGSLVNYYTTGGAGGIGYSSNYNTAIGHNTAINAPAKPKFTITQDSDGTWHITVNTKSKKFIRGVLQTLLNDCDDLDLEESIEVTKKLNAV